MTQEQILNCNPLIEETMLDPEDFPGEEEIEETEESEEGEELDTEKESGDDWDDPESDMEN